jgi:hypothetical protein
MTGLISRRESLAASLDVTDHVSAQNSNAPLECQHIRSKAQREA